MNQTQREQNSVRCQKIANYLGSNGVKTNVLNSNYNEMQQQPDKITNVGIERIQNVLKMESPKKKTATFRHVYESKRVYYD